MKNLLFSLCLIFSANAMADEFVDLDFALDKFILNRDVFEGKNSKGEKCEVKRTGRSVNVINTRPGCIDPVYRTINLGCSSHFKYHLRDKKMKEFSADRNYLIAVVKQEDDEEYSSAETSRLEISKLSSNTTFKVSSRKSFFGSYKYVLDCTVK